MPKIMCLRKLGDRLDFFVFNYHIPRSCDDDSHFHNEHYKLIIDVTFKGKLFYVIALIIFRIGMAK